MQLPHTENLGTERTMRGLRHTRGSSRLAPLLALFLTAIPMALFPEVAPLLFGIVSAACFFIPGLIYHRKKNLTQSRKGGSA